MLSFLLCKLGIKYDVVYRMCLVLWLVSTKCLQIDRFLSFSAYPLENHFGFQTRATNTLQVNDTAFFN